MDELQEPLKDPATANLAKPAEEEAEDRETYFPEVMDRTEIAD